MCRGPSRLEELPDIAHRHGTGIPIRVVPRTLTETKFWVGKPLDRFALEAEQFPPTPGLDTLHRHLRLNYRMSDGREAKVSFAEGPDGTRIRVAFDPESENPIEMQQQGWQAILDSFGRYVEGKAAE